MASKAAFWLVAHDGKHLCGWHGGRPTFRRTSPYSKENTRFTSKHKADNEALWIRTCGLRGVSAKPVRPN